MNPPWIPEGETDMEKMEKILDGLKEKAITCVEQKKVLGHEGKVVYGWVSQGIGYIQWNEMQELKGNDDLDEDMAEAGIIMDKILTHFGSELQALMLDIRFN